MGSEKKLKPIPQFRSDEDAAAFVAKADLSEYDLSGFRPTRFEFDRKTKQVNLRMPERMLDAVKAKAKERGIPYQRYIREVLEKALG